MVQRSSILCLSRTGLFPVRTNILGHETQNKSYFGRGQIQQLFNHSKTHLTIQVKSSQEFMWSVSLAPFEKFPSNGKNM